MVDDTNEIKQIKQIKQSLSMLEKRISSMGERIESLETSIGFGEGRMKPTVQKTNAAQDKHQALSKLEETLSATEKAFPVGQDISRPQKPQAPQGHKSTKQPPKNEDDLEYRIGSNLLNRIGILAIILGVGFFLKLTFENQWIGETGRILIGLLAGMVFIGAGERFQKKSYHYFAQGLSGGGLAILYLSVFAAYRLFKIIPAEAAFIFIALVVITSVVLALRYNAAVIAALGFLGGYLAPAVLSSGQIGEGSPLTLFAYTLSLSLGIVVLAIFRQWSPLVLMGFLFTCMSGWGWAIQSFHDKYFWMTLAYATAVFVIYTVAATAYGVRRKIPTSKSMTLLALFNGAMYALAGILLISKPYGDYLGIFSILLALIYFAISYGVFKFNSNDRILSTVFVGLAILFVTITVPIQLEKDWFAFAWSFEAFVLVWVGLRYSATYLKFAGLISLGIAFNCILVPVMLIGESEVRYTQELLNRALTFLPVIAASFGIAYLLRSSSKDRSIYNDAAVILALFANVLIIVFLSIEISQLIEAYPKFFGAGFESRGMAQLLAITLLWSIYSAILIALGIYRKIRWIRVSAICLFFVTIIKLYLVDLSSLDTVYRILSFIALGVILVAVSLTYQHYRDAIFGRTATEGLEA